MRGAHATRMRIAGQRRPWRAWRYFAPIGVISLSACSDLGYYAHLARGEYALLAAREPIAQIVTDPHADAQLKARLELAERARAFASDHLDLPRNGSYTEYADLHRPYAMWNVYAAPEFSLAPLTHCFPIAGCVAYRGYYELARAQTEARRLQARGYETYIGGVPAYSTLGWFDDPILNTMLRWDDDTLAATIFHELAHQKLYLKGDTAFNESYATFVQEEGLREWRAAQGLPPGDDAAQRRDDQFTALVLDARSRLAALYAQKLPPEQMRERKAAEIETLRADYRALRDREWAGVPTAAISGYDAWMSAPINNAKLLPFGLYHQWVPAFAALFAEQNGDWPRFFAAVKRLARLDAPARAARLAQLTHAPSAAP